MKVEDEHLSTITVQLGRTDWEARFHIPIEEVKVLVSNPYLLFGR